MTKRPLIALLSALALLIAASAAHADTYYVNQSNAAASDGHTCKLVRSPCLTIQAAVDKAKASAGNTVRVLPDPSGATDTYGAVSVAGGSPITLRGAGAGDGGTHVDGATSPVLNIVSASTVSDLSVASSNGSQGLQVSVVGVGERLDVQINGKAAVVAGVLRDSRLNGLVGGTLLGPGRLVRCDVQGTFGLELGESSVVVDTVIRAQGSNGVGLTAAASGSPVNASLRHVTVSGFATRLGISGFNATATVNAVNSTFAGKEGTIDVDVENGGHANFDSVNRSPLRTQGPGTITDTHPLDVNPVFTRDGHLPPGSPLIDRGTTGGALAGNPDDALDIDRAPRNQGAAPDVGADETGPAAPVGEAGTPDGGGGGGGAGADPSAFLPPVITDLKVAGSFRSKCPRPRRGQRSRCRAGVTIGYALTEAATVELAFKQIVRRRRRARTFKVTHRGRKGRNTFRFSGKVRGLALPAGRYTLTAVAKDASGKVSVAVTARTRVS